MKYNVVKWKLWEPEPEVLYEGLELDAAEAALEAVPKDEGFDYLVVREVHWAQHSDLKDIDLELLEKAEDVSSYYCYDAVNLSFSRHSSTSGMYGKWHITIDVSCTVYMGRTAPSGYGRDVNEALRRYIASCIENKERGEYQHLREKMDKPPN